MKCDLCDNPAVVHEVTVKSGVKKEVHLCKVHAEEAGFAMPAGQSLGPMLTQFVISPTGSSRKMRAVKKTCPGCGLSYARFRQKGLVGCPQCYDTFERHLTPLIERAQNGASNHVGKSPRRAGTSIDRQLLIQQLLRELDDAVAAEQYERAATLRDRLQSLKQRPSLSRPEEPAG